MKINKLPTKLTALVAATLLLGVLALPVNPSFWCLSAKAQIPPPEPCHAVMWWSAEVANGAITFYVAAQAIQNIGEVCFTKVVLYHVRMRGGMMHKTAIATNNIAGTVGPEPLPWFSYPVTTNSDLFAIEFTRITNASPSDIQAIGHGPIKVRMVK